MAEVMRWIGQASSYLDSYPFIANLATRVGVPSFFVALVLGILFITIGVMGYGANAICGVVGTIPPAYLSYKAIKTKQEDEVKQWLTYWIVFSLYLVAE
jgi:receptor expression-enhancing protein 5/6